MSKFKFEKNSYINAKTSCLLPHALVKMKKQQLQSHIDIPLIMELFRWVGQLLYQC